MLNIGCGSTFHKDWVNIDIHSTNENVIEMDIRKGIDFKDNSFDVVYSSHVLEHMSKANGETLVAEMVRVLKPGGIIRLVVPNLGVIINNYSNFRNELNSAHNEVTEANYDWTMIELYDQVIRTKSGGMMVPYLLNPEIANKDFVIQRFGWEAERIMNASVDSTIPLYSNILKQINILKENKEKILIFGVGSFGQKVDSILMNNDINCTAFLDNDELKFGMKFNDKRVLGLSKVDDTSLIIVASSWWKEITNQLIDIGLKEDKDFIVFDKAINPNMSEATNIHGFKEEKLKEVFQYINKELGEDYVQIFKEAIFRNSGEIHKWMYDSFSLARLMGKSGILNSKECLASESKIPNFINYKLDILDGKVRKPDSLFMEGFKKN